MNNIVIKTEDLSRDYGSLKALDKANISIEKGRVVVLLGPNGAGKTTFLHLLMGMLEPTEGEAKVLGADSRAMPGKIVNKIGYIGDGEEPPRWISIKKMVNLQAGASENFNHEFARQFLSKRHLSLKHSFGSLSKGQKKWVRAALVIAAGPDILLLDEPADGLDPSARLELYNELRDYINDAHATVIVATHIIGDIERIADDVAIINHGKIVTHAGLEDLRDQVREIQLPGSEQAPVFGNDVEVLGSKVTAGVRLVWIKSVVGQRGKLANLLPANVPIRSVGLETFYLAMTEHNENNKAIERQE
ncbi:MAG: ABC transporter ATP-binding protein [Planctomycetota bacterium]|jgi:ABC-2 type transport system ATP-binding protein